MSSEIARSSLRLTSISSSLAWPADHQPCHWWMLITAASIGASGQSAGISPSSSGSVDLVLRLGLLLSRILAYQSRGLLYQADRFGKLPVPVRRVMRTVCTVERTARAAHRRQLSSRSFGDCCAASAFIHSGVAVQRPHRQTA